MEKKNKQSGAKDTREKNTKSQSDKQEHTDETGFWNEAKENVTEGAKIISEEAKHLGQRIAKYSETLFGKIKDNTSEVFQYGLDLTSEGAHKAQEMAENLKDDFDIRKLNTKKKEVATQLGIKFYLAVKNNKNEVPENILKDKEVLSLLKELEQIDKEILNRTENTDK